MVEHHLRVGGTQRSHRRSSFNGVASLPLQENIVDGLGDLRLEEPDINLDDELLLLVCSYKPFKVLHLILLIRKIYNK